ncbi:hypothetical protein TNCV_3322571 [Trichonephila clavipes]|nr:hypothetical protein TNCV_3322571 [Trichonephila clavipes]
MLLAWPKLKSFFSYRITIGAMTNRSTTITQRRVNHRDHTMFNSNSTVYAWNVATLQQPNIHGKILMLWKDTMFCIWWDQLAVTYYEFHKPNKTITGTRYRTKLM